MINTLLIMTGGGLGAVLRYIISSALNEKLSHWATFWVNVTGCFFVGFITDLPIISNHEGYLFLIVGLLGAYTTFSAFEYENIDLIAHEKYSEFLKYSTSSFLFCIIAFCTGKLFIKLII